MISMPLLKRNLLSSLKIMAILYAVMTMYTVVIIYMYDPALADMLDSFQSAIPEMMRAFGMSGIASNLLEFIQIYLYGFIIRYPSQKQDLTGYEYEPWHIRYLGKELAKKVEKSKLTFDEYYARYF